jgi:hypothetical protein
LDPKKKAAAGQPRLLYAVSPGDDTEQLEGRGAKRMDTAFLYIAGASTAYDPRTWVYWLSQIAR